MARQKRQKEDVCCLRGSFSSGCVMFAVCLAVKGTDHSDQAHRTEKRALTRKEAQTVRHTGQEAAWHVQQEAQQDATVWDQDGPPFIKPMT